MGLVTTCDQCGGETRPYDGLQEQPCRACLVREIERLTLLLGDALAHCPESYRRLIFDVLKRKVAAAGKGGES